MKSNRWLIGWSSIVLIVLISIGVLVYEVDPFFHFHKPDTEKYYYTLNNQRSQNDGIVRHFEYDALITGTSMTENFKASELDELFGVNSIKVSFSGASYKEINDNIKVALANNSALKLIVRSIDAGKFYEAADFIREDMGVRPDYLYDNNPFNDVYYVYNKDVIFGRIGKMITAKLSEGFEPGITSFDAYSRWQQRYTFGIKTVRPNGVTYKGAGEAVHLTDAERKIIFQNITQNITDLADEYPEVDFYYFITPYSVILYKDQVENGTIYRSLEAEQYVIELILEHENIKLFSFNNLDSIVADINNYKDSSHYGEWINSYILHSMYNNEHRLTKDNYKEYMEEEYKLLFNLDYEILNEQEDYVNDFYAAALFNESIWEVQPIDVLKEYGATTLLSNAEIVKGQYENTEGIRCVGRLNRERTSGEKVDDYIKNTEYIGARIKIDNIGKHNYLVFYGKKVANHGQPMVLVYDSDNKQVGRISANYKNINDEWRQYIINLNGTEGDITVYFNGGYVDSTGSSKSEYIFSNIMLY